MSSANGRARPTVDELARRLRPEMAQLNSRVFYYAATPIPEEDLRQYVHEPVGALPPATTRLLPKLGVVLAPYLQRIAPKGPVTLVQEKPADPRLVYATTVAGDDFATLFLTVKDEAVADFHYGFFDEVAGIIASRMPPAVQEAWHGLLREELTAGVHGEVDERSWREKQRLLRRPENARKDGKPFRDYARESFRDTMTLFLHGICCDIDVETGPRQIPSRYLRKRLETLKALFPPPEGHAVFPEDLQPK